MGKNSFMDDLKGKTCVPCRGDSPPATEEEISTYHEQIPEWEIIEVEGVKRLTRIYKFKNFKQALEFTNRVGEIAERENHHPLLITEWGKTTVQFWTHVIGGLHENDFIMAAKSDQLFQKE
jgi:4a-hydroxytetrahydrobiopterin dehydratase